MRLRLPDDESLLSEMDAQRAKTNSKNIDHPGDVVGVGDLIKEIDVILAESNKLKDRIMKLMAAISRRDTADAVLHENELKDET